MESTERDDRRSDGPAGFEPFDRIAPVLEPWVPIWSRKHGDTVHLSTEVRPALCNNRSLLHGGVMTTLADIAMGVSLAGTYRTAYGGLSSLLTTSLAVDFVASAQLGDWLLVSPRVVHVGRSSGVVDAILQVDDRIVARASATFRMRRKAEPDR